jgi:hypothetical protein
MSDSTTAGWCRVSGRSLVMAVVAGLAVTVVPAQAWSQVSLIADSESKAPLVSAEATTLPLFAQPTSLLQDDYIWPDRMTADIKSAVRRGDIPDPALRIIPEVQRRDQPPMASNCVTSAQIFAFEDTNGVLSSNFSNGQLFALMTQAANSVIATHGDNFDFNGYFLNFNAHHTIGAAFYAGIFNEVSGIGSDQFDARNDIGLNSSQVQGYIMMWNVNTSFWAAGDGPSADFTRLALGQEFEHRFAMFLPDLLDGRPLQGNNGSCGRGAHWNWRVDGQGSSMEISDWVGSNPAVLSGSFVTFNTDIPGSVFSYTDLYLMGYVSPDEMDAGNSELRYMNSSTCDSIYNGVISTFSSADIAASAGQRVPDSTQAQKDFRTAWIMFYRPGDPPSQAELDKAVGILNQHQTDWALSTLGRGIMDDTLFDDCNCNGIPDSDDITSGDSSDDNGNGIPDECEPCLPDLNNDGTLDFFDVQIFLGLFAAQDSAADLNGDGVFDFFDVQEYLNLYAAGCP